MSFKSGKAIGCTLSYASFILSGMFIYNPLHKSKNIAVSLFAAFICAYIILKILLSYFDSEKYFNSSKLSLAFSLSTCTFSIFATLMLITEVIKETAYVANRGISLLYYIILTLSILAVSCYLAAGNNKGIFRFSILAFQVFLLVISITPLGFVTTKSVLFSDLFSHSNLSDDIISGIKSGIFLICDSAVYICCFRKSISNENGKLPKKCFISGILLAFILLALYNITTVLIFGSKLTSTISDPDYALIKLIPGPDFTEAISALRIISFLIKSSVYLSYSSTAVAIALFREKNKYNLIITVLYILIPAIVITLTITNPSLGYGEFQNLIFPVMTTLSLSAIITNILIQKNN